MNKSFEVNFEESNKKNIDVSKNYFEKKAILLKKAANSVLKDINHKTSLEKLRNILSLSENEIIKAYINYDLDISKNNNEMYQSIALRYVLHMHNLLKGSWHIERQKMVLDFIKSLKPTSVADMGFGVPSLYIHYILQKNWGCHVTLCDIDSTATIFSKALFEVWGVKNWHQWVTFQQLDMNTGEIIPNQDIYIFQSSIEHVKNCTFYLKKHIDVTKAKAYFLLALPIGNITPEHYMEWKTKSCAVDWLDSCGLKILSSKSISVNPKVDLFADYHYFQYTDFFVLCEKKYA